ncbi:hypothetical protein DPMN_135716 [Dreissena polymorpha]|uniref:Uncharacterized protein n=1 Tax=Dreissena polymorpha TaxID=45954 RepID=A0A9D4G4G3_DREPO|nr:hypothetical protein DPMN_135716 [Dreissena polymorpha]
MFIQKKIPLSPSLTFAGRAPVHSGLLTPVDRRGPGCFVEKYFNAVTQLPKAAPVEAGQQPGRVLVNPDWQRFIPVKPRQSPDCRRKCPGKNRQRTDIAPIVAGSAPVEPR